MKKKTYILTLAVVLVLGLVAFISGAALGGRTPVAPRSGGVVTALPASDVVIVVDANRLLTETLPAIFVDNPEMLAKVNEKIERCNKEMGVDLRTFENVAVGLRFASGSTHDFDAVVIARGHFNANQVIDSGFAAATSKHQLQKREEQYEGRTIYIAVPKRSSSARTTTTTNSAGSVGGGAVLTARSPQDNSSQRQAEANNEAPVQYEVRLEAKSESDRAAVVALDANTIAAGDLAGVRAAVDASLGRSRVDDELVRMATQDASALVGFSGRIPATVTEKMAGGRGRESQYFASVRQFYGSFGMSGTEATAFVALRTETANQAQEISQALNALKVFSGFSTGHSAGSDAATLSDLFKGLSITTQDNEVQLKLNVQQKVLAPFIHRF